MREDVLGGGINLSLIILGMGNIYFIKRVGVVVFECRSGEGFI